MPGKTEPLRLFLSELAKYPRQMGTVWPSSPALARAMARWLPAASDQWILELGPGTGIVTEQLLAAGLPEHRLVAVEKSPRLAGFLRDRFPQACILSGDALELGTLLEGRKVGAVFSSLPLKVFSPDQVRRLSQEIHQALLPDGHWVQYSYQLVNGHSPAASFHAVDSSIVWKNLPPAKVSVYRPHPHGRSGPVRHQA
ncbi:MAG TPA: methyltransferase domain-containing protein [Verrucomicrobiota bacterium]|nr:methyltransferase [Verrucomicrobiales bacterium]HRI15031.1 methyltransferase domain-containing protein [Verrucomicrobiota bacterium]